MFKLSDIVPGGAIIAGLQAEDREGAILELVHALAASGAIQPGMEPELASRVLDRERRTSTGFGHGVAVPHAKHPRIPGMVAAIGLAPRGLDFASLDKQPVYSVFLLVSPEDKPEEHLRAMEIIFKNLSREAFRRELRRASSVEQVRGVLEGADSHRSPV